MCVDFFLWIISYRQNSLELLTLNVKFTIFVINTYFSIFLCKDYSVTYIFFNTSSWTIMASKWSQNWLRNFQFKTALVNFSNFCCVYVSICAHFIFEFVYITLFHFPPSCIFFIFTSCYLYFHTYYNKIIIYLLIYVYFKPLIIFFMKLCPLFNILKCSSFQG